MPALPLTCGALENRSYGVFGASGDPAMNPFASGPTRPVPVALWPTNVRLASALACRPNRRGAGTAGDAAGEGVAHGAGDAAAVQIPRSASTIHAPAKTACERCT